MRVRVSMGLWATVGFVGGAAAVIAIVNIAGLHDRLASWLPFADAGLGANLGLFVVGVSLGFGSLWGIYAQTVNARKAPNALPPH